MYVCICICIYVGIYIYIYIYIYNIFIYICIYTEREVGEVVKTFAFLSTSFLSIKSAVASTVSGIT